MALVRGTSLSGLPELVASLGGDPGALLDAVGIAESAVGNADTFVPLPRVALAIETAAAITATPDFGRRLAGTQGIEILGPVGVAARTAATAADALAIFEKFLAAYTPGLAVRLGDTNKNDTAFFEFLFLDDDLPDIPQSTELSLGVTLRILRFLIGDRFTPVSVHLPHDPLTPLADYRRFYRCTALFAQPATGFTIYRADLEQPLRHDRLAHETAVAYLTNITDPHDSAIKSVRILAGQLLPTGGVTLGRIAAELSLHPKALQRRLADEHTTFAATIDQLRRERAEHLLRHTQMPLSHLAQELGYAEHSVLTRSCRRWFGCPPNAHRKSRSHTIIGLAAD
jgi:AraC-like DNA-binding protein